MKWNLCKKSFTVRRYLLSCCTKGNASAILSAGVSLHIAAISFHVAAGLIGEDFFQSCQAVSSHGLKMYRTPKKTNMTMKETSIWRCISCYKWWFSKNTWQVCTQGGIHIQVLPVFPGFPSHVSFRLLLCCSHRFWWTSSANSGYWGRLLVARRRNTCQVALVWWHYWCQRQPYNFSVIFCKMNRTTLASFTWGRQNTPKVSCSCLAASPIIYIDIICWAWHFSGLCWHISLMDWAGASLSCFVHGILGVTSQQTCLLHILVDFANFLSKKILRHESRLLFGVFHSLIEFFKLAPSNVTFVLWLCPVGGILGFATP